MKAQGYVSPQDRLRPYLANSLPPFPREKQRELLLRWRAGDEAAGDLLTRSHLRFAARVAIEFHSFYKQVEVEDMFASACEGMLIGLRRFSLDEKYSSLSMITYLVSWIKQRLYTEVRSQHLIRQPLSRFIWAAQFWKFKEEMEKDGEEYALEEVYDKMKEALGETWHQENRLEWLTYQFRPCSLDRGSIPGEKEERPGDAPDFEEVVADMRIVSQEDAVYQQEVAQYVNRAVSQLPEVERFIIERVYGLQGMAPRCRSEVAKEMGLSRQRVDQIYSGIYGKKKKKKGGRKTGGIMKSLRRKLSKELLVTD